MTAVLDIIALSAIITGTFFSVVGVIGFIRMPDVYTRLHATGKVGVFGVVLLLIAAIIRTPLGWGRGAILILFLMITGPVTAHAIASAAARIGLPLRRAVKNDLMDCDLETTEGAKASGRREVGP